VTTVATYRVFGRAAYADPLRELGALAAEDAERARGDSLERFGEGLIELTLVPEAEVVWILREPEEDGDDGDVG
jgi:hypothetical protein